MQEYLSALSQLGPALGSVVAIAVFCYKVLSFFNELFRELLNVLRGFEKRLDENLQAINRLDESTKANVTAIHHVSELLDRRL